MYYNRCRGPFYSFSFLLICEICLNKNNTMFSIFIFSILTLILSVGITSSLADEEFDVNNFVEKFNSFENTRASPLQLYNVYCHENTIQEGLLVDEWSNVCKVVNESDFCKSFTISNEDKLRCDRPSDNGAIGLENDGLDSIGRCGFGIFENFEDFFNFISTFVEKVRNEDESVLKDMGVGLSNIYGYLISEYARVFKSSGCHNIKVPGFSFSIDYAVNELDKQYCYNIASYRFAEKLYLSIFKAIKKSHIQLACYNTDAREKYACKVFSKVILESFVGGKIANSGIAMAKKGSSLVFATGSKGAGSYLVVDTVYNGFSSFKNRFHSMSQVGRKSILLDKANAKFMEKDLSIFNNLDEIGFFKESFNKKIAGTPDADIIKFLKDDHSFSPDQIKKVMDSLVNISPANVITSKELIKKSISNISGQIAASPKTAINNLKSINIFKRKLNKAKENYLKSNGIAANDKRSKAFEEAYKNKRNGMTDTELKDSLKQDHGLDNPSINKLVKSLVDVKKKESIRNYLKPSNLKPSNINKRKFDKLKEKYLNTNQVTANSPRSKAFDDAYKNKRNGMTDAEIELALHSKYGLNNSITGPNGPSINAIMKSLVDVKKKASIVDYLSQAVSPLRPPSLSKMAAAAAGIHIAKNANRANLNQNSPTENQSSASSENTPSASKETPAAVPLPTPGAKSGPFTIKINDKGMTVTDRTPAPKPATNSNETTSGQAEEAPNNDSLPTIYGKFMFLRNKLKCHVSNDCPLLSKDVSRYIDVRLGLKVSKNESLTPTEIAKLKLHFGCQVNAKTSPPASIDDKKLTKRAIDDVEENITMKNVCPQTIETLYHYLAGMSSPEFSFNLYQLFTNYGCTVEPGPKKCPTKEEEIPKFLNQLENNDKLKYSSSIKIYNELAAQALKEDTKTSTVGTLSSYKLSAELLADAKSETKEEDDKVIAAAKFEWACKRRIFGTNCPAEPRASKHQTEVLFTPDKCDYTVVVNYKGLAIPKPEEKTHIIVGTKTQDESCTPSDYKIKLSSKRLSSALKVTATIVSDPNVLAEKQGNFKWRCDGSEDNSAESDVETEDYNPENDQDNDDDLSDSECTPQTTKYGKSAKFEKSLCTYQVYVSYDTKVDGKFLAEESFEVNGTDTANEVCEGDNLDGLDDDDDNDIDFNQNPFNMTPGPMPIMQPPRGPVGVSGAVGG